MDGQWDYYSRAARRRQAMGTRLNRVAMGCFLLGLLLAGSQPYFQGNPAFKVAFGLAPAAAALSTCMPTPRAFLEQARQYDRMSQLFGNARGRLRRVLEEGDFEKFQHLLFDLGKEALRENGDWVLLHRERPLDFGGARTWLQTGSWIIDAGFRRRRPRAENVLTLINSTQRNDPMAKPQSLQTGVEKKLAKQGPRKLLALDSGGIRGLMTIEILAEIERTLRRLFGRGESFVLADYFDYIGGTSIGAITAMGLSLGMSVDAIREFYVDAAPAMFQKTHWWSDGGTNTACERLESMIKTVIDTIPSADAGKEDANLTARWVPPSSARCSCWSCATPRPIPLAGFQQSAGPCTTATWTTRHAI